jgi:hypothetical protein
MYTHKVYPIDDLEGRNPEAARRAKIPTPPMFELGWSSDVELSITTDAKISETLWDIGNRPDPEAKHWEQLEGDKDYEKWLDACLTSFESFALDAVEEINDKLHEEMSEKKRKVEDWRERAMKGKGKGAGKGAKEKWPPQWPDNAKLAEPVEVIEGDSGGEMQVDGQEREEEEKEEATQQKEGKGKGGKNRRAEEEGKEEGEMEVEGDERERERERIWNEGGKGSGRSSYSECVFCKKWGSHKPKNCWANPKNKGQGKKGKKNKK